MGQNRADWAARYGLAIPWAAGEAAWVVASIDMFEKVRFSVF